VIEPHNDEDLDGLVDLQDTIHGKPGIAGRIGIGLRALYNKALMERLPGSFSRLLERLGDATPDKKPPKDE